MGEWTNCLRSGDQSDNLMIDAGITALISKPSVALGSCYVGFTINSNAVYYARALKSNGSEKTLPLYWSAYESLRSLTEAFKYMPTIALPIHLGNHWGMCIVIPHPERGGATMFWGDSLKYDPPPGLLPLLRAVLLLLFRHTTITIDQKNYMSDVLGFENQHDAYSCGFYVLAAFSTLSQGTSTSIEVPGLYFIYDAALTERYRSFCYEKLVSEILRSKADLSRILSDITVSMTTQRRRQAVIVNCSFAMYEEQEGREKLRLVDDLESVHEAVQNIDINHEIPRMQGIYSLRTLNHNPRPMVACLIGGNAVNETAGFLDVIDRRTVEESKERGLGEDLKDVDCPIATENGATIEESISEPSQKLGNTPCCPSNSMGLGATEEGENELMEFSGNFFEHLKHLLLQGHILAYPYVKNYVKPHWVIRVRLRCRRYKVPKNDTASSYEKCQARLLAQLRRYDKVWEMRLLFKHNHDIEPFSLSESDILTRLKRLKASLSSHYPGIVREFASFVNTLSSMTTGDDEFLSVPNSSGAVRKPVTVTPVTGNVKAKRTMSGRTGSEGRPILPRSENPENGDLFLYTAEDVKTYNSREGKKLSEEGRSALQVKLMEAVHGYLESVNISVEGADIVREVKHLMECFGYCMRIRRSSYLYGGEGEDKNRKQLQRADFECSHEELSSLKIIAHKSPNCQFKFTVFTDANIYFGGTEEELEKTEELDIVYSARFKDVWHNHPPSPVVMKKTLPPDMLKEAVVMKNKSLISTDDIIRHLEDRFGCQINRRAVSRQLRWQKRKAHPADLDCQRLIQNLLEYCNSYPEMFAKTRVVEHHTLHSVCWSFPEWREDFMRFGVVPGVSIDAKALANCYNIPLITICGRSSKGALCLFFMGFIPSEDMDGFSWIIRQFVECMGVSPWLWACDQDFAIIGAIKTTVPDALIILDDWHLNKNQLKNTGQEARKGGDADNEMSNDLHALRRSMTPLQFTSRREAFEEKYFGDGCLPKWFTILYHYNADLVVKCYNRTTCGPRFFFQGSGYSESANAVYRKVVMKRDVRMAQVPEEMRRHYRSRIEQREVQERSEKFKNNKWKLIVALYGYTDDMWNSVVQSVMPAALQYFFDHSIKQALRYIVRSPVYIENDVLGGCVQFEVTAEAQAENGQPTLHRVVCPLSMPENPFISSLCSCSWHRSTGIPCRHAVRVATLFKVREVGGMPSDTKMPGKFPLHAMFHSYWRRDRKGWVEQDILAMREGRALQASAVLDGGGKWFRSPRRRR